jgi:hypothetical protein
MGVCAMIVLPPGAGGNHPNGTPSKNFLFEEDLLLGDDSLPLHAL